MKLIVAVDKNWAIGNNGNQLIYLKDDLKHFRSFTMGKTIIAGRKTLSTFPEGKPLQGRKNLILSSNPSLLVPHAQVFHTLDSLLAYAPEDSIVIGGASVYAALLPHCTLAHVTKIHTTFPADTWFPNLDQLPEWIVQEESDIQEEDGVYYHYVTYRKQTITDTLS